MKDDSMINLRGKITTLRDVVRVKAEGAFLTPLFGTLSLASCILEMDMTHELMHMISICSNELLVFFILVI